MPDQVLGVVDSGLSSADEDEVVDSEILEDVVPQVYPDQELVGSGLSRVLE